MPALPDDMYCSEQICIPPSFPYLLRQYAKAAIRSQPSDLLKWSTAYFRCLSLNVPPPVKPRLEYPIPRDFKGITPGWLKALIYQLQNNLSIPFKILWDRWIGACLQHHTLIQLLCLGGFDDPQAIPWLKFVAICAGTLTDDLTHTMILICEVLTEEPEGGSAMIPLETFIDLYQFLARIDASKGQSLRNYYFRDSLLSLWKDKVAKEEVKEFEQEEVIAEVEESLVSKSSTEELEEEEKLEVDRVVSCPSLPEDDHYSIDYLMKDEPEAEEDIVEIHADSYLDQEKSFIVDVKEREGVEEDEFVEIIPKEESGHPVEETEEIGGVEYTQKSEDIDSEEIKHDGKYGRRDEHGDSDEGKEIEQTDDETELPVEKFDEADEVKEADNQEKKADIHETSVEIKDKPTDQMDEKGTEVKEYESVDTITDQPVRDLEHVFDDDASLQEDLERLRALQQELAGETDEELEKFKCRLIEEMPLTESQQEGIKQFAVAKMDRSFIKEEKIEVIEGENIRSGDVSSDSQNEEVDKRPYDDVYVEAIPGIGGTVPNDLINAVVGYMKNCAEKQHGMVMPRNIRHYSCPPLEVMNY